jgi:hypothetical protein
MQRKAPNIDTCFYCGTEYHPMMIWSMHHQNIRYVCSYYWDAEREELRTQDVCENKARADGYEPWPERTPKR